MFLLSETVGMWALRVLWVSFALLVIAIAVESSVFAFARIDELRRDNTLTLECKSVVGNPSKLEATVVCITSIWVSTVGIVFVIFCPNIYFRR
jgi:hypothetical protein